MSIAQVVPQEQVAALQQAGDYTIKSSSVTPQLGEYFIFRFDRPLSVRRMERIVLLTFVSFWSI